MSKVEASGKEIHNRRQKKLQQDIELTNKMLYFGLWQYPEVVTQKLNALPTIAEKKEVLKTQILFRKKHHETRF